MKNIFIAILVFIWASFSVIAIAQTQTKKNNIIVKKPDFEEIKQSTQDESSKYFFPKLLEKYRKNDTIMDLEDYRHLYYGYSFQEDYDPYRESEYANKIKTLYFKKSRHTNAECDTIMKYAEQSLEDNPFDLRQMSFYIIALKEKRKNARASIWQYRLNHLVEAILSSGNGSEEKPWYVISPSHEYNILNFMNFIAKNHQSLENSQVDYLEVEDTGKKNAAKGFYFDVSRVIDVNNIKFIEPKAASAPSK